MSPDLAQDDRVVDGTDLDVHGDGDGVDEGAEGPGGVGLSLGRGLLAPGVHDVMRGLRRGGRIPAD